MSEVVQRVEEGEEGEGQRTDQPNRASEEGGNKVSEGKWCVFVKAMTGRRWLRQTVEEKKGEWEWRRRAVRL